MIQIPQQEIGELKLAIDYQAYLKSRRMKSLLKGWAGCSLQHASIDFMKPIDDQDYVSALLDYQSILTTLMGSRFEAQPWILQHEKPQYPWLPPHLLRADNFEPLYTFFERNHIDFLFDGATKANFSELQEILPSLVCYPSFLHYQDIVLLHEKWKVIIKITHHFTVDLITDDPNMLNQVMDSLPLESIKVVHYRRHNE